MVFSLLWVCESPKWGLELEYARLTELIPWLPALQSVPVRQSSFSALNTTNSPALRAKAGLGGYPPGIELGGSERVVRAAGPATQRNPAPPFFRRKDKGQPISLLHYFANRLNSAVGCGTIWTASGVLPILQGSRFFSTEKRRGRRCGPSCSAASATRPEPPRPTPEKNFSNPASKTTYGGRALSYNTSVRENSRASPNPWVRQLVF